MRAHCTSVWCAMGGVLQRVRSRADLPALPGPTLARRRYITPRSGTSCCSSAASLPCCPVLRCRCAANSTRQAPLSACCLPLLMQAGIARCMALWLAFRLMYQAGVVKLTSGCPTWWHLTALDIHHQGRSAARLGVGDVLQARAFRMQWRGMCTSCRTGSTPSLSSPRLSLRLPCPFSSSCRRGQTMYCAHRG